MTDELKPGDFIKLPDGKIGQIKQLNRVGDGVFALVILGDEVYLIDLATKPQLAAAH